ncbi:MAG: hypothetical protein K6G40_07880 [Eubacterium sp.]|nr:hypothetical protein [Eubacterium sp.]
MRIVFINGGCSGENIVKAVSKLACEFAIKDKETTLVMECGQEDISIREAFSFEAAGNLFREELRYFSLTGFDYLAESIRLGKLSAQDILCNSDSILKDRLYILPAENTKRYQNGINEYVNLIADEAGVENVLIAAGDIYDERMLSSADLIVVCMGEENLKIEDIFAENAKHIDSAKVFYLICEEGTVYNKANLKRIYRIKDEKIAQISFGEGFDKYYKKGKVKSFSLRSVKFPGLTREDAVRKNMFQNAAGLIREAANYG